MGEASCIFCEVVAGRIAATIVYRDEWVTAFRDLRPAAPVHILVVPNAHFGSIADLDGASAAHAELLGRLFAAAATVAAGAGLSESGYRLVINRGRDGGQSVDHLHLHVLGGRRLGWPPG